jgi:hypothetical protein
MILCPNFLYQSLEICVGLPFSKFHIFIATLDFAMNIFIEKPKIVVSHGNWPGLFNRENQGLVMCLDSGESPEITQSLPLSSTLIFYSAEATFSTVRSVGQ